MEFILFASKQQLNKAEHEPFKAGSDLIELSNKVKYLGGVLDKTLKCESHVQNAMSNVIKIKSVCKYITREACTTLVLMLHISHLDYSNALLYGQPKRDTK